MERKEVPGKNLQQEVDEMVKDIDNINWNLVIQIMWYCCDSEVTEIRKTNWPRLFEWRDKEMFEEVLNWNTLKCSHLEDQEER